MFQEVEDSISPSPEEVTSTLSANHSEAVPVVPSTHARFVVVEHALSPPHIPPRKDKPYPKIGVGTCLILDLGLMKGVTEVSVIETDSGHW